MGKLPDVMRIPDVAKLLGVHMQTIHNMIRRGDIPAPRRIGKGRPYYLGTDVARFVQGMPAADEIQVA